MNGLANALVAVCGVVVLTLLPFATPAYYVGLMIPFYGYAIALLGFNLLFGYAGLLSFGHAMFLGIGAYGAAIMSSTLGVRSFELTLVVVIGGLGSMRGALAGALIVGLIRALSIVLYPELEVLAIYLIVIAVLIFRPAGLFGRSLA